VLSKWHRVDDRRKPPTVRERILTALCQHGALENDGDPAARRVQSQWDASDLKEFCPGRAGVAYPQRTTVDVRADRAGASGGHRSGHSPRSVSSNVNCRPLRVRDTSPSRTNSLRYRCIPL